MFLQFLLFIPIGLVQSKPVANNSVGRLVELSYTYDNLVPTYPGLKRLVSIPQQKGPKGPLKWLYLNNFCSSEHTGTHMDAPAHFTEKGKTIDLISINNLYRISGIKIDLTEKAAQDKDYLVHVSDLEGWVNQYGELPDGVVVLFNFGYGKYAHDEDAYLGRTENGELHWPAIGGEAAKWLINYGNNTGQTRGVLGVGLDVVSLDSPLMKKRPAHITLLGGGKFGIENMMNLDELPPYGFTLTMMPIKLGGGSGGPSRIIAEIGGSPYTEEIGKNLY